MDATRRAKHIAHLREQSERLISGRYRASLSVIGRVVPSAAAIFPAPEEADDPQAT